MTASRACADYGGESKCALTAYIEIIEISLNRRQVLHESGRRRGPSTSARRDLRLYRSRASWRKRGHCIGAQAQFAPDRVNSTTT
jgi:hypothetical protein